MKHTRRLGALASGLLLYSTAVMVGGLLAGWRLPPAFLALLGPRDSLSRLLGDAAIHALPIFAMALVWSYVTLRPYRRRRQPATGWCLCGLGLAWLGWLLWGVVEAADGGLPDGLPLSTLLLSPLMPPLWGLMNTAAVLAGVLLAAALARRHPLLHERS